MYSLHPVVCVKQRQLSNDSLEDHEPEWGLHIIFEISVYYAHRQCHNNNIIKYLHFQDNIIIIYIYI